MTSISPLDVDVGRPSGVPSEVKLVLSMPICCQMPPIHYGPTVAKHTTIVNRTTDWCGIYYNYKKYM